MTCRIAAKRLRHVTPCPRSDAGACRAGHAAMGHHLPDRGQAAIAPCPRPAAGASWHQRRGLRPRSPHVRNWATWAGTGHHLPDRGQAANGTSAAIVGAQAIAPCPRRDAGPSTLCKPSAGWHRRPSPAGSRPSDDAHRSRSCDGPAVGGQHLPDRGRTATSPTSRRRDVAPSASTCRIAAKRRRHDGGRH